MVMYSPGSPADIFTVDVNQAVSGNCGSLLNVTNSAGQDDQVPTWADAQFALMVDIDIKPGSFPNSINPRSRGIVPVAILSSDTFDASSVDVGTLSFGPSGASPVHGGHIEQLDGNGPLDLVVHFRTRETGIACGDTAASLTGATLGGVAIEGLDSVRIVGCR